MTEINFKKIKGLFLDMDGVLWSNQAEIGHLSSIFEKINELGLVTMFGSNNATKTPQEYIAKLEKFGVHTKEEQFFSSGIATVDKLKEDFPQGPRVHVFGTPSLVRLLEEGGITVTDENVDAVLVSMDWDLTYEKMAKAMQLIMGGAKFYATNLDNSFPTEKGWMPGSGAVVAAVACCSGVEPYVVGKPNTHMIAMACRRYGLEPSEVIAVGDRHSTDILGGYNAGAYTALVMTGYETPETLSNLDPQPDLVCKDLTELISMFSSAS